MRRFLAALNAGFKATLKDPKAAIAHIKAAEPLSNEATELKRLQLAISANMVNDEVRKNGLLAHRPGAHAARDRPGGRRLRAAVPSRPSRRCSRRVPAAGGRPTARLVSANGNVPATRRAGPGGPPRGTRCVAIRYRTRWGHEIGAPAFGNPQKTRSRGEGPLAPPGAVSRFDRQSNASSARRLGPVAAVCFGCDGDVRAESSTPSGAPVSGDVAVTLSDVALEYVANGRVTRAVEGVSLEVPRGATVAFVGPSGCGKSTLLKLIAGLLAATVGDHHGRRPACQRPAEERRHGVSEPRAPALAHGARTTCCCPSRSCARTATRACRTARRGREKAKALLGTVGLAGAEQRQPRELSGGMRQRVSLCRALIHEPALLLLDEPFAALDAFTREEMWELHQALRLHREFTGVLVTHDLREAVFLAQTIYVMSSNPGRIAHVHEVGFPRAPHAGPDLRRRGHRADPAHAGSRSGRVAEPPREPGRGAPRRLACRRVRRAPHRLGGGGAPASIQQIVLPPPSGVAVTMVDTAGPDRLPRAPDARDDADRLRRRRGARPRARLRHRRLGHGERRAVSAPGGLQQHPQGGGGAPARDVVRHRHRARGAHRVPPRLLPGRGQRGGGARHPRAGAADVLRVLGASRWQIFRKVGVPRTMPLFFASLKVAVSSAFVGSVISETVASNAGIGYLMAVAASDFNTRLAFARPLRPRRAWACCSTASSPPSSVA